MSLPFDWDFLQDNKTPAEVRIAVTGAKGETSEKIEKWDTFYRTILGRCGTATS